MHGNSEAHARVRHIGQQGIALLLALVALLVLSIIGLYLALIATTEVRISDNFESYLRARSGALAGLSHARALLRGVRFDDLLQGPDGTHDAGAAYLSSAKTHAFRMPLSWSSARIVDIVDPTGFLVTVPDDGVINAGPDAAGNGVSLIPLDGISHAAANPSGPGMLTTVRYFVKVTDNNGEPSEIAADPTDDPFVDGDGQIILRSMGIARTIAEGPQAGKYSNSVVVFEARFKRFSIFALDAPVVVQSSAVEPASASMFTGNTFLIQGGVGTAGIAGIDTSTSDGLEPAREIESRIGQDQKACILGGGANPPIQDITASIAAHTDKRLLLDKAAAWRFLRQTVPRFADNNLLGAQNWTDGSPVPLGNYDPALPPTSPGQDPRVTYVDGDLLADGYVAGGGLLVVTGKASLRGHFTFNGLILVLGAGVLDIEGWSTISGAIFLATLSNDNGNLSWGTAKLSIGGNSRIRFDRGAVQAAVNLIPAVQLGCREITPIIDP